MRAGVGLLDMVEKERRCGRLKSVFKRWSSDTEFFPISQTTRRERAGNKKGARTGS